MKVLITGAAGFLGQGLVLPFEEGGHTLRLLDVVMPSSPHECLIGSVESLDVCMQAVAGMDGVVIAHMAPRGEDNVNYRTPPLPFDVNVKGTANLFHAATLAGVKSVVVISSTSAVEGYRRLPKPPPLSHELPARSLGIYGLTKAIQEVVAEQYSREFGLRVACLRIGYVLDGDRNRDKYGRPIDQRAALDTDRRDIGAVALACLEDLKIRYEVFHVMSAPEAMETWDLAHTCQRLGWRPKHDFSWLRPPDEAQ